jgi:hypothetical protein
MTWDVRTNMKAKPGSQGVLFRGGADQMTDAKWPRHYTPERMAQVKAAVAPGQRSFRDEPYLMQFDTAGEQRKLIDNIARSTVPAAHLNRLQFSPGKSETEMSTGSGDSQMIAGGTYTKPPSANPNSLGVVQLLKGDAEHPVAIHEIGHHASHVAGTMAYGTPAQRGAEEGKADTYAQEHFRDRRGRSTSWDGYRYMRPDPVRNAEFFDAYHGARPRQRELEAYNPDPHLPGLDARTVFKAGRKQT